MRITYSLPPVITCLQSCEQGVVASGRLCIDRVAMTKGQLALVCALPCVTATVSQSRYGLGRWLLLQIAAQPDRAAAWTQLKTAIEAVSALVGHGFFLVGDSGDGLLKPPVVNSKVILPDPEVSFRIQRRYTLFCQVITLRARLRGIRTAASRR